MNDRDIRRGDIFYIKNDDNAVGFEQKKTRPAIIVSNNANNRASGVVEIVYLTTSQKHRPLPTTFEFAVTFRPSLSVSRL